MTEAKAPISRTINKRTPPFTTPIATFPHDKTTQQKPKFPADNVYTPVLNRSPSQWTCFFAVTPGGFYADPYKMP